jgi:hypothetical protein
LNPVCELSLWAKEELTGIVDELRELIIVVDEEMHHPVEYEYTDPSREEQDPVLLIRQVPD